MKVFDKISFKIFSIVILIISLVMGLILLNILDASTLVLMIEDIQSEHLIIAGIVVIIFFVWSVKNIVSGGKYQGENSEGILLENKNGKLLITKESISNMISKIVENNNEIDNTSSTIEFDENNNISVFLVFSVKVRSFC